MGREEKPCEVASTDFFSGEEWIGQGAHPLKYLCPPCQELVKALEHAAYVLKFQPLFHSFSDEQLWDLEDYFTGENRDTMKLPGASATQPQQQNFTKQKGGIPFLKNEHLDSTARAATILDARYDDENQYGPQVVVKLAFGPNRNFKWGLRVGKKQNPNYDKLVRELGDDSDNWKGKVIQIALEQDGFNEQEYPTVVGFGELESAHPKKKG